MCLGQRNVCMRVVGERAIEEEIHLYKAKQLPWLRSLGESSREKNG